MGDVAVQKTGSITPAVELPTAVHLAPKTGEALCEGFKGQPLRAAVTDWVSANADDPGFREALGQVLGLPKTARADAKSFCAAMAAAPDKQAALDRYFAKTLGVTDAAGLVKVDSFTLPSRAAFIAGLQPAIEAQKPQGDRIDAGRPPPSAPSARAPPPGAAGLQPGGAVEETPKDPGSLEACNAAIAAVDEKIGEAKKKLGEKGADKHALEAELHGLKRQRTALCDHLAKYTIGVPYDPAKSADDIDSAIAAAKDNPKQKAAIEAIDKGQAGPMFQMVGLPAPQKDKRNFFERVAGSPAEADALKADLKRFIATGEMSPRLFAIWQRAQQPPDKLFGTQLIDWHDNYLLASFMFQAASQRLSAEKKALKKELSASQNNVVDKERLETALKAADKKLAAATASFNPVQRTADSVWAAQNAQIAREAGAARKKAAELPEGSPERKKLEDRAAYQYGALIKSGEWTATQLEKAGNVEGAAKARVKTSAFYHAKGSMEVERGKPNGEPYATGEAPTLNAGKASLEKVPEKYRDAGWNLASSNLDALDAQSGEALDRYQRDKRLKAKPLTAGEQDEKAKAVTDAKSKAEADAKAAGLDPVKDKAKIDALVGQAAKRAEAACDLRADFVRLQDVSAAERDAAKANRKAAITARRESADKLETAQKELDALPAAVKDKPDNVALRAEVETKLAPAQLKVGEALWQLEQDKLLAGPNGLAEEPPPLVMSEQEAKRQLEAAELGKKDWDKELTHVTEGNQKEGDVRSAEVEAKKKQLAYVQAVRGGKSTVEIKQAEADLAAAEVAVEKARVAKANVTSLKEDAGFDASKDTKANRSNRAEDLKRAEAKQAAADQALAKAEKDRDDPTLKMKKAQVAESGETLDALTSADPKHRTSADWINAAAASAEKARTWATTAKELPAATQEQVFGAVASTQIGLAGVQSSMVDAHKRLERFHADIAEKKAEQGKSLEKKLAQEKKSKSFDDTASTVVTVVSGPVSWVAYGVSGKGAGVGVNWLFNTETLNKQIALDEQSLAEAQSDEKTAARAANGAARSGINARSDLHKTLASLDATLQAYDGNIGALPKEAQDGARYKSVELHGGAALAHAGAKAPAGAATHLEAGKAAKDGITDGNLRAVASARLGKAAMQTADLLTVGSWPPVVKIGADGKAAFVERTAADGKTLKQPVPAIGFDDITRAWQTSDALVKDARSDAALAKTSVARDNVTTTLREIDALAATTDVRRAKQAQFFDGYKKSIARREELAQKQLQYGYNETIGTVSGVTGTVYSLLQADSFTDALALNPAREEMSGEIGTYRNEYGGDIADLDAGYKATVGAGGPAAGDAYFAMMMAAATGQDGLGGAAGDELAKGMRGLGLKGPLCEPYVTPQSEMDALKESDRRRGLTRNYDPNQPPKVTAAIADLGYRDPFFADLRKGGVGDIDGVLGMLGSYDKLPAGMHSSAEHFTAFREAVQADAKALGAFQAGMDLALTLVCPQAGVGGAAATSANISARILTLAQKLPALRAFVATVGEARALAAIRFMVDVSHMYATLKLQEGLSIVAGSAFGEGSTLQKTAGLFGQMVTVGSAAHIAQRGRMSTQLLGKLKDNWIAIADFSVRNGVIAQMHDPVMQHHFGKFMDGVMLVAPGVMSFRGAKRSAEAQAQEIARACAPHDPRAQKEMAKALGDVYRMQALDAPGSREHLNERLAAFETSAKAAGVPGPLIDLHKQNAYAQNAHLRAATAHGINLQASGAVEPKKLEAYKGALEKELLGAKPPMSQAQREGIVATQLAPLYARNLHDAVPTKKLSLEQASAADHLYDLCDHADNGGRSAAQAAKGYYEQAKRYGMSEGGAQAFALYATRRYLGKELGQRALGEKAAMLGKAEHDALSLAADPITHARGEKMTPAEAAQAVREAPALEHLPKDVRESLAAQAAIDRAGELCFLGVAQGKSAAKELSAFTAAVRELKLPADRARDVLHEHMELAARAAASEAGGSGKAQLDAYKKTLAAMNETLPVAERLDVQEKGEALAKTLVGAALLSRIESGRVPVESEIEQAYRDLGYDAPSAKRQGAKVKGEITALAELRHASGNEASSAAQKPASPRLKAMEIGAAPAAGSFAPDPGLSGKYPVKQSAPSQLYDKLKAKIRGQELLDPRKLIPTEDFDRIGSKEKIDKYQTSLAKDGWDFSKEPIQVAVVDGQYYVMNGHHRLQAAMQAGLAHVPIEVIDPRRYQWKNDREIVAEARKVREVLNGGPKAAEVPQPAAAVSFDRGPVEALVPGAKAAAAASDDATRARGERQLAAIEFMRTADPAAAKTAYEIVTRGDPRERAMLEEAIGRASQVTPAALRDRALMAITIALRDTPDVRAQWLKFFASAPPDRAFLFMAAAAAGHEAHIAKGNERLPAPTVDEVVRDPRKMPPWPRAMIAIDGHLVPVMAAETAAPVGKEPQVKAKVQMPDGSLREITRPQREYLLLDGTKDAPIGVARGTADGKQFGHLLKKIAVGGQEYAVVYDPDAGRFVCDLASRIREEIAGSVAVNVSPRLAAEVDAARERLDPKRRAELDGLLFDARSPEEQLLLMRAFAAKARLGGADAAAKGVEEAKLFKQLVNAYFNGRDPTPAELLRFGAADGLVQYYEHSCAITSQQYMRAQLSPLEAARYVLMGRDGVLSEQAKGLEEAGAAAVARREAGVRRVIGADGALHATDARFTYEQAGAQGGLNAGQVAGRLNRELGPLLGMPPVHFSAFSGSGEVLESRLALHMADPPPEGVMIAVKNVVGQHAMVVTGMREYTDASGKTVRKYTLRDPGQSGGAVIEYTDHQMRMTIEGAVFRSSSADGAAPKTPAELGKVLEGQIAEQASVFVQFRQVVHDDVEGRVIADQDCLCVGTEISGGEKVFRFKHATTGETFSVKESELGRETPAGFLVGVERPIDATGKAPSTEAGAVGREPAPRGPALRKPVIGGLFGWGGTKKVQPPDSRKAEPAPRHELSPVARGYVDAQRARETKPDRRALLESAAASGTRQALAVTAALMDNPLLSAREIVENAQASLAKKLTPDERLKATLIVEAALADKTATVAMQTPLGGKDTNNANTSYLVRLTNGAVGVWKPRSGEHKERIRDNIPPGGQGAREVAAYLIDEAMGHAAHVPPVVARELDNESGSLMAFVEAHSAMEQGWMPEAEDAVRIFDEVSGNLDRHTGNFLVSGTGEIIPIDHGLILPEKNGPQGHMNTELATIQPLTAAERTRLEGLVAAKAELSARLLAAGIDQRAIDAMYTRVERLLERNATSMAWWQT